MIDKIYCINLDRRPDRWKKMHQQFLDQKIEVQRVSAVDGKVVFNDNSYNAGIFGCFSSHLKVFEDAITNEYKTIIILEDDAVLKDNFKKELQENINSLPSNWQMCYLGGSNMKPPLSINDKTSVCIETLSTVGYIVKLEFVKSVLLPTLKRFLGKKEIDSVYIDLQKQHQIYITNPRLVYQIEDYSDIQMKTVNYSHQRDF